MTTYTKTTNFLAKDSLPLNDAGKYVKGSEIDTEFNNIASADADNLKISALASNVQTFLGTPTSSNLRSAITDETGTGSLYFADGALGTPASGTLTNCTGLPAAGVTGTALVAAAIGTTVQAYDADLTTWAGKTAPTGDVIGTTDTQTLTNKRFNPRVGSTASSGTPTINTDNYDIYKLTAQTVDITSFTTNLSGTPVDGQVLIIQITGTGARGITWGSSFEASTVALPTTTVSTNMLSVGFIWNTATSKWRCVAAV